jgi:hypothetical protein
MKEIEENLPDDNLEESPKIRGKNLMKNMGKALIAGQLMSKKPAIPT